MSNSGGPITTLRGAGVDVDVRRVGRALVGLAFVALGVVVVALFLAGAHRNDQITRLRQQGVGVDVRVSGCLGLLGGSGSNIAGYDCRGTFTLDGHRYHEAIPGNVLYQPGTTIEAVAVPGDPELVSTRQAVATEHPSERVFILPGVLGGILVLGVAAVALRRSTSVRRLLSSPAVA